MLYIPNFSSVFLLIQMESQDVDIPLIIEGPIGNQRDFKTAFFKESKVKVGEGVAILNETYYTK